MRLKPEEVQIVNALRTIKGAGKVRVSKSHDGALRVETDQELAPLPPVQQSEDGRLKIHRLKG